MKFFRKLMAGAMAIAMLSAYMVAFAVDPSATSGAAVSGAGSYAGSAAPVFLMKLPTSAANASLAFTVDPKESVSQSAPANAITPNSTYGTVIFSTKSGNATQNTIYKNESEPLTVMSMSSVDVKVNMFANLTDTKMKISTTSGFTGTDAQSHLYLGVQVATLSGGVATNSGGPQAVGALGVKNVAIVPTVPGNFKTEVADDGSITTLVSGASSATENAAKAGAIADAKWKGIQYTVVGYSNPNADWDVAGIAAPNLKIKWQVYAANEITYEIPDPKDTASTATYTAILDKTFYKTGDTVYVYVKPVSATAKLKTVKFKYISLKADGTMDRESYLQADIVNATVGGVTGPAAVNGVYSAKFTVPSNMARYNSPAGTITTFTKPSFEITVG